ncbi:hypothetical protein NEOLEDRAFT_1179773 [Neolentinus lepideus HHB14362 ss-1]|uniref:Protein kinase domain-containing protein n=1 Tax=Neolentinus lepideus HHB14362 ss-1 TaxID=1314782 RepID=A0A165RGJ3_9AGAM|nr:hypothetical protein NEOLEDRAFT_1179773 [Neolentinus lepideus HHB14362 ss-1]
MSSILRVAIKRHRASSKFGYGEAQTHRLISHPNIIELSGLWFDEETSLRNNKTTIEHYYNMLLPAYPMTLLDLPLPIALQPAPYYVTQLFSA